MKIRRSPRPESRFYILDKNISEDRRLSWAARGMLIYLLGKPDNWEVSVKHLMNQTADAQGKSSGRDGVRVILKELEQVGYMVADIARSEGGAFAGMSYTVYETPVTPEPGKPSTVGEDSPEPENPSPASPKTEKPAPADPAPPNPHLISNESKPSTEINEKAIADEVDYVVEVFDYWRLKMTSPRSKLDEPRRKVIIKALKHYEVEDLKLAIQGCANSPFHMGVNEQKTKYNGLDLILRNAEKIDGFIEKAKNPPVADPRKPGTIHHNFQDQTYQSTPKDQIADFLRDDE